MSSVEFEYTAFAAADVLACYKQDGNEVYTVAVRSFGGWSPNTVAGVNAKLVCFDIPRLFTFDD